MAKSKPPTVAQKRAAKLDELKAVIRGRLARFWPKRAGRLRRLIGQPPPPGTTHVHFEIHDACNTLTVVVFAVGADGERDTAEPFGELLGGLQFPRFDAVPWDAYRRAIGRKAEPVIEEVLVEELSRLWVESGGAAYPLPAVIGWHDSSERCNLRQVSDSKASGEWSADYNEADARTRR